VAPFTHGLRCGEIIHVGGQVARDADGRVRYPGDIVTQSEVVMEQLAALLAGHGATLDDAVKLNIYYVSGDTRDDWQAAAAVWARSFTEPGPVATAIPVPWLPDGLMVKMELVAMLGVDGSRLPRRHVSPEGRPIHRPYTQGLRCGNMVFVGGQVSDDSRGDAVDPGQLVAQTRTVMGHVTTALAGFGLARDDVVKVNAFFRSGGTAEELNANLRIRSASFTDPGPATTGIPLPVLASAGVMIQVEVIAMA
jgi:enamine deaminase RidA (YjgF/YER057c/UK114 family)